MQHEAPAATIAAAIATLGDAFSALSAVSHAVHGLSFPWDGGEPLISQPTTLLTLVERSRGPLRELAGILSMVESGEQTHVAAFGGRP